MMKWYHVKDTRYNVYDYVQCVNEDTAFMKFMMENGDPLFDEDIVVTEVEESKVPHKFKAHV